MTTAPTWTAGAPLRLVALTADSIRALVERPDEPVVQRRGADGVDRPAVLSWPEDDRRVLRYRSRALADDPAAEAWLLHAALDADGTVVARIGCHAAPVDGRVEVGYYVRAHARGRGIATWMLAAFSTWLADRGVRTVVLSMRPDNEASLGIARRAGFVQVGEREDDEDGVELVLERVLTARA